MAETLKWFRLSRVDKAYATEGPSAEESFRIEPDWRWSDRLGKRVPDGWVAYKGRGPTRKLIGTFDQLGEAKDALSDTEGEQE